MADKDGQYRRKESSFRDFVSKDPSSKFPAEKNRYALYVNYGCPWAHRTILVRGLKNMDDNFGNDGNFSFGGSLDSEFLDIVVRRWWLRIWRKP